MEVAIVFISLFVMIFGIVYLYFTTRHKERLSLIDKGMDVSIFYSPKPKNNTQIWKIVVLNLALLLIGVGFGIFLGNLLFHYTLMIEAGYPAAIFLMSGIALLVGFYLSKNLTK